VNQVLLDRVCACPNLPSLPAVALEILQATDDADAELSNIASIVNKDAALAARLLKTVNCSAFGVRRRVTSLPQALGILGLRQLKTLATSLSFIPALTHKEIGGLDQLKYCRRSLYSANAAKLLAEKAGLDDPDGCFLAGLLMDLGMLALGTTLGADYSKIVAQAERHVDLEALELQAFGLSHAQVSSALVGPWRLPEDLAGPIRFHHQPDRAPSVARQVALVLRLAGLCAAVYVETDPLWLIAEVQRLAQEDFAMAKPATVQLLTELAESTRSLGSAFEVQIDATATLAQVQRRFVEEMTAAVPGVKLQDTQNESASKPKVATKRSSGAEHRREARAPCKGFISVFPWDGQKAGESKRVEFRDISPSGIGLKVNNPEQVGNQFIITLRQGPGRATVIVYTVRHIRAAGNQGFHVGCEATSVLREHDIRRDAKAGMPATPLHQVGRLLLGVEAQI
jgi:HD-like signal output (HDOD) protein